MSVNINYINTHFKKNSSNLVLFTDYKFNLIPQKKYLSKFEFSYVNDLLKTSDLKKNLFVFEFSSKKKIVLVSIKKDITSSEIENLGAEFYKRVNYGKNSEYLLNSDSFVGKPKNSIGYFLHGFKLKSYEFTKYKSKQETRLITLNVIGNKNKLLTEHKLKFKALEEGTFFARDLVSEPGNILHPDEYAKRLKSLKKNGLIVKIYDKNKLKKLGMNALLGVGQGSVRGSYLVTIEWKGIKNNSKPLAFILSLIHI